MELIERNQALKKDKEDLEKEKEGLEVKVWETNARKRKLEENVEDFENEKKRIKLQLATSKEDYHTLLSEKLRK